MITFKLRSTELRDHQEVHRCVVLKTLSTDGPSKLLVSVDPPIPGHFYDEPGDLDRIVLAPRHANATLAPQVSEWPCYVHICLPKHSGDWEQGPFRSADWGVIEM